MFLWSYLFSLSLQSISSSLKSATPSLKSAPPPLKSAAPSLKSFASSLKSVASEYFLRDLGLSQQQLISIWLSFCSVFFNLFYNFLFTCIEDEIEDATVLFIRGIIQSVFMAIWCLSVCASFAPTQGNSTIFKILKAVSKEKGPKKIEVPDKKAVLF